jgi:hypothetical protein
VYSGFINEKKKASLAQKIAVFIRGNFFIPDARKFWINPSIRFLKKYLAEHPVDAIVSTGPPHSMHLIAEAVHQATGIPWIADFRDPWTNIDFYKDLRLTSWADKKQHVLELKVLKNATKIVTVSWIARDEFKDVSGRKDIEVVPNGFDDADFPKDQNILLDEEFSILHMGSMNNDRNPSAFWQALQQALQDEPTLAQHLRIRLIGPIDYAVRTSVEQNGLLAFTEIIPFVPHTEAVSLQQQAQVLLLIVNHSTNALSMVPGKLYEYIGARRPILAIAYHKSDAAYVIRLTESGDVHEYDDVEGLKKRILEYYSLYKESKLTVDSTGTQQFTRRHLAGDFAKILENL